MYKDEEKTIVIPNKQILRFQCCDCGLVHDIKLKSSNDNPVTLIFVRNNRATGQLRRRRQITFLNRKLWGWDR